MINPASVTTADQDEYHSLAALFIEYTSKNLFITGKAGTGKTTFLKRITEHCSKKHVVLAPTGVAAINAQGTTINAFFQIPPGFYVPPGKQITNRSGFYNMTDVIRNLNYSAVKKDLLRRLDTIIIDEVSMVRGDQLDLLDLILRHIKDDQTPFGGIQLVLIGDLFQLPPVVRNEDVLIYKQLYPSPFFFSAIIIGQHPFIQIEFNRVYRQSDDKFIEILNQIRSNTITNDSLTVLNKRYLIGSPRENAEDYIIITSHNAAAQTINTERLDALPEIEYTFEGEIKGEFKDNMLPIEKTLKLKKGAHVMFIKNDSGENRRYFNGKMGRISSISQGEIKVIFPDNVEIILEKVSWYALDYSASTDNDSIIPIQIGEFSQYPVKLAWAATIHKSQGLTFEKAIIDAANSFEAGQVYVALSRVRTLEGLILRSEITRESIQFNNEVLSFHAPLPKEELERLFAKGQIDFLLEKLFEEFLLKPVILILQDLFAKPETFKQKINTASLILFGNILDALISLNQIITRFTNEIKTAALANLGYTHIAARFASAKTYLTNKISQDCFVPLSEIEQVLSNHKIDQHTKAYWEKIKSALHQQNEGMNFAVNIVNQLSEGAALTVLFDQLKQSSSESHVAPVAKAKNKRSMSVNKSIQETIAFIQSGKKIDEISSIRNLGISTIENHILEALKLGLISAEKILEKSRLDAITAAVNTLGNNVYDIKEQLGDEYSFFEIRIGISEAN